MGEMIRLQLVATYQGVVSSLIAWTPRVILAVILLFTALVVAKVIEKILANPELIVIDSRKKTEYLKGHIEGAINILNTKLQQEDLERIVPDKDREILFYCNGTRCMRSTDSIRKAKRWGYTNLIWFRGGWKEWSDKRLPMVSE